MNFLTKTCDSDRLEAFLRGDLIASDERELTAHLDECVQCRQELEQRAAEPSSWGEAQQLLQPQAFDAEPLAAAQTRLPLQMQHVLDALGPTDDPEMLGRLGNYEVSGVVGAGAMGVVLKAFDKSLDRTVAIKVLAPHLASSGAARKRFAREAKAAAAVLHPNVMAIHGVSSDEALPYFVMPYVRGSSLQKRLGTEGPLTTGEVLRIASQIAAGLAAAHAQGLVHRDIKPANIMLEDGVERVAITDFGLARAVDDATMTRTGVIAGTPQYMSPEQARGEFVDQRSDLFSLGSVLYSMCTGRAPFRAETSYGVLRRITDEEPRPIRDINPDIPQWLCELIARLMSKHPEDRFESAGEVAELLEECLAHVQQPAALPLPKRCRSLRVCRAQNHPVGAGPRFLGKPPANAVRLMIGAAFFFTMIFAGILIVLELNKGTLTIECEADDVPLRIMQGDKVVEKLTVTRTGTSVRIAAGKYVVEIDGNADGIIVKDGRVQLQRGGKQLVRIVRDESARVAEKQKDDPPSIEKPFQPGSWPMLRQNPSLTAYQPMPGSIGNAPAVVAKYHVGTSPAEEVQQVDLFGRGQPNETLVCASSRIIAYDSDGEQLWNAHQPGYDITETKWVADLDGDGTNEVVAAAGNLGRGRHALVAFDAKTGKFLAALDFTFGSGWHARCCPFLAEQPGKQILLAQGSRRLKLPYLPRPPSPDGDFSLWKFDGKKFVRQWHLQTSLPPDAVLNHPEILVGDTEGDGRIRAVVASSCHVWYLDPNEGKVLSHSTLRPQQPQRGSYGWNQLLDVDGDGRLDYVNVAALQCVNFLRNAGMRMEPGWSRGWQDAHLVKKHDITSPSNPWGDLDGDGNMECLFAHMDGSRGHWEMHVADGKLGTDIVRQSDVVPIATMRAGSDEKSGMLLLCARTQGPVRQSVKAHEVWTYQSGKLEQIWSSEKDRFVLKDFEPDESTTGYHGFRLRTPVTGDVDGDGAVELFTVRDGEEHPRAWGYDKQKQFITKPGLPAPQPPTPKIPPQGKSASYLLAANLDGKAGNELLLYDEDDEEVSIQRFAEGKWNTLATMPSIEVPICIDLIGDGVPQVLLADRDDEMNFRIRVHHPLTRNVAWQFVFPGSADVDYRGLAVGRFTGEKHWDVIAYVGVPASRLCMLNGRTGKVVWERGAAGGDRLFQPHGGRGTSFDYNGDGADDFMFANPDHLCIANGRDGKLLFGPSELTHMTGWWTAYSTPTLLRNKQDEPFIYLGGAYSSRAALRVGSLPDRVERGPLPGRFDRGGLQSLEVEAVPTDDADFLRRAQTDLLWSYAFGRHADGDDRIRRAWMEHVPSDRWALYEGFHYSEGLLPPSKTADWRGVQVEADGVLNCFEVATGKARWRLPLSGHTTNIASCDVDGDGDVECLLGTRDGKLMAIRDDGQRGVVLWEKQFTAAVGSPILADITGNGKSEVIVNVGDGFIYVLGDR